jgi:hypothetical protein
MLSFSSNHESYLKYRKQLEEHKQAGYCAFTLSCKGMRGECRYCQDHRDRKTTRQRERRAEKARKHAATKVIEGSCDDLDVSPRVPLIPQTAPPTHSLRGPDKIWNKVIWVTYPDDKPLEDTATLAVQIFPDDRDCLGHAPWLAKAYSMRLKNTVKQLDEQYYIHQGLVTILAAGSLDSLSFNPYTWDLLYQQLKGPLFSDACIDGNGKPLRSVLFLHWTTDEPTNPTLDQVYEVARTLLKVKYGTSFRVYPNESEAMQEREKLGDIGVLDEVARSSPQEFAYRPKTCTGLGACVLRDCDTTVHKRTHSGCAAHVRVVNTKDCENKEHDYVAEDGAHYQLTCDSEVHPLETPSQRVEDGKKTRSKRGQSSKKKIQPFKKPKHSDKKPGHWFHQEFVPSLKKCEFRVFITTEPSERDIRGRTGRVLAIAKTAFNGDEAVAVREFLPEDLESGLTKSDLESFALFIFKRLRERADSMIFFESLEVGVRLDIGVAKNERGEKSFFVNEITRWYGAHYFSHHLCAEPKTQICKAFGDAFRAFLTESTGSVF